VERPAGWPLLPAICGTSAELTVGAEATPAGATGAVTELTIVAWGAFELTGLP
jgi:hypothetical protein